MKGKGAHHRRSAGTKGKLIRGFIENVSRDIFDIAPELTKKHFEGKSGLYALYKNADLYYVGMSENLYKRLVWHMRDRHKKHWNYFSAYVIHRVRYIKDLEAIVLMLGERRGNRRLGKFPRRFDIKRRIAPFLKDQRRKLSRIFWKG